MLFMNMRSPELNSYCINFNKRGDQNVLWFIMEHFDQPGWGHVIAIDDNASDGVQTGWIG